MSNFKPLVDQTKTVLSSTPEQAIATFSVEGLNSDKLYRTVKVRQFEVGVDEQKLWADPIKHQILWSLH